MELAERLKINRSNIASYESETNPPVDVLIRMAELFGISLDMLINTNIEEMTEITGAYPLSESISPKEVMQRMQQFIALTGKNENDLGKLLDMPLPKLKKFLKNNTSDDLLILCKLFSTYGWLNTNWLFRGGQENPIRLDEIPVKPVSKSMAADTGSKPYQTNLISQMDALLKRIEQLEKKTGKNKS